jgi:predicted transcriptional regulator of viral defense system
MQTLTEKLIQAGWAGRVLLQAQLARLFDGTSQRRYNLVNRALQHGELLQLRRGCYVLAPYLQHKPPHPFVLAQALQPGSYISFETALSFHGWIPESVPVTLSVLPGRRRLEVMHAAFGLFRFYPLALRQGHFLDAVDRHTFAGQTALVAQPIRALLDIFCLRKLEFNGAKALTQSLRIDDDMLLQITPTAWQTLLQVYSHKRMTAGIHALQQELAA